MKIHYKTANWIFLFLYLLPIMAIGVFVQQRIQRSLITAQQFMQNQVDIDRKILTYRGYLRTVQPVIRSALLKEEEEVKSAKNFAAEKRQDIDKFWKTYETSYMASERPFLRSILAESQELNLIEEEERVIKEIKRNLDNYFTALLSYSGLNSGSGLKIDDHIRFFDELDIKRDAVYDSMNQLTDLRYIFSQRIVFFITSQAGSQEAIFNAIFITLALMIIVIAVFQHFYIHRPLGDIMLFLKDTKAGQRRQRLYFSSPIKEIKESEEIINDIIETAEEHEEHEEHK